MQQAGESKAESSRSLSWCVAGTEEALTLWSWTSRGDYSQQNLRKTRWMEHFSEVLNRPPPPPTEADIQEAETDLDVNTHPPEKKRSLQPSSPSRAEKSPGQDNLSAEVFKADPQLTANLLQLLFTDIREGKKLPEDWTESLWIFWRKVPSTTGKELPYYLYLARSWPRWSWHSGPTTEKRAGRVSERKGMHIPDLHPV